MQPRAYYNEIDPHCAEWLFNLQKENLIAPGDIDTRPIQDVRSSDLTAYTQCHFFAGIGGWSLALRQAGYPDHQKIWTGSCPCQPFSAAGRRLGFADDRHLWPFWRYLIAVGRPAIVLGEQVASASDWLRLVRGDLEALDYAVGAMPVEAASAGADHLRDRYWFVGNRHFARTDANAAQSASWCATGESSGLTLADDDDARSQGWNLSAERGDQRIIGQNGVAHAASQLWNRTRNARENWRSEFTNGCAVGDDQGDGRREGRAEHAIWSGRPTVASNGGASVVSDTECERVRGQEPATPAGASTGMQGANEQRQWLRSDTGAICDDIEWVLGADGKARRVKSGVRLLVDGVSGRVAVRDTGKEHWYSRIAALKGFGNAIDSRPAAAFIKAALDFV